MAMEVNFGIFFLMLGSIFTRKIDKIKKHSVDIETSVNCASTEMSCVGQNGNPN